MASLDARERDEDGALLPVALSRMMGATMPPAAGLLAHMLGLPRTEDDEGRLRAEMLRGFLLPLMLANLAALVIFAVAGSLTVLVTIVAVPLYLGLYALFLRGYLRATAWILFT
jgi:hypothetical protein